MPDDIAAIQLALAHLTDDPHDDGYVSVALQHLTADAAAFAEAVRRHCAAGPPAPVVAAGQARQTWTNGIQSVKVQPLRYFQPTDLPELQAAVLQAVRDGVTVKAVGTGYAFTDVGETAGYLIDTRGLNHVLVLDTGVLRDPAAAGTLVQIEGGILVREVNAALEAKGLGLINMGAFTGQTVAGALATSTHGSGLGLGAIPHFVAALMVVGDDGAVYQIEPADGITDPTRFAAKYPGVRLVQDDDWFHAATVGVGCLGVVYALTVRVTQRYWLRETRRLGAWSVVREELRQGDVLRAHRHYEVLVSPHPVAGEHPCLVTVRDPCPEPRESPLARAQRQFVPALLAGSRLAGESLMGLLALWPQLTPGLLKLALETLTDDGYEDLSYRVLDVGVVNHQDACASEYGLPMDRYLDAVDEILRLAEQGRQLGRAYHTAPVALRWVRACDAYLSMQYGADTCMIEVPLLCGTPGGREIHARIDQAMQRFNARPHWGQLHEVTGCHDRILALYPRYDRWQAVYNQLNASRRFNNAFTRRCGF